MNDILQKTGSDLSSITRFLADFVEDLESGGSQINGILNADPKSKPLIQSLISDILVEDNFRDIDTRVPFAQRDVNLLAAHYGPPLGNFFPELQANVLRSRRFHNRFVGGVGAVGFGSAFGFSALLVHDIMTSTPLPIDWVGVALAGSITAVSGAATCWSLLTAIRPEHSHDPDRFR